MGATTSASEIAWQIVLIIILTLMNAFFAATEMAMVSLDKHRLDESKEKGDRKAIKILKLLEDPSRFLSTIQLCITLAGFLNSASAATGISRVIGASLAEKGIPSAYTVSTILITILLSFFTIVFGELVPKRFALTAAEKYSRGAIGILTVFAVVFFPFVKLLSASTNGVLKLLRINTEGMEEEVSLNDIKALIQVGRTQGIINPVESEMIRSVITFNDKHCDEIMTPRREVFMIDIDEDSKEYISDMLHFKYSRIPVYEDGVDNIIGILYLKDYLLESYKKGFSNVDIRKILRPAYFIPEKKKIGTLFNELQSENKHIAILIDEYGGFSGIVTMEDLIEEIIGDIDDEFDHDEPELKKIDDWEYWAMGTLSIKELNFNLGTQIDETNNDYDTLGGFIIHLIGVIPQDGKLFTVEYENMLFHVKEVSNNKIKSVMIQLKNPEE
ncbi:hemolysin family protein [Parasporobacterium paucivorans]|uniref:Putative hemolysin n=1 Tax=Parasporobacterium paucivorans DSM 15970 TaxID=1122934 RepID=A0A1M6A7G8_9FIRM|nr:hemolysin family protein [Parasporobacterium paucivorans]SHI32406.1 putative hemolysin [Parasporobacterium paucivorans DSM 15970]